MFGIDIYGEWNGLCTLVNHVIFPGSRVKVEFGFGDPDNIFFVVNVYRGHKKGNYSLTDESVTYADLLQVIRKGDKEFLGEFVTDVEASLAAAKIIEVVELKHYTLGGLYDKFDKMEAVFPLDKSVTRSKHMSLERFRGAPALSATNGMNLCLFARVQYD